MVNTILHHAVQQMKVSVLYDYKERGSACSSWVQEHMGLGTLLNSLAGANIWGKLNRNIRVKGDAEPNLSDDSKTSAPVESLQGEIFILWDS